MVSSMTAFSRNEVHYVWGSIFWEIRSLNQRYLDIYIDLPKNLSELSWIIRKKVKSNLARGKIECSLQLNVNNSHSDEFFVDKNLVSSLIFYARWIQKQVNESKIDPMSILCYPGVFLKKTDTVYHCMNNDILIAFEKTLDQLIQNRKTEGLLLKDEIKKRLQSVSEKINSIQHYIPDVIQRKRTKLLNQVYDAYLDINSSRLEQELLIIIQKMDISEEIDRLIIHVKEINRLLSQDIPVGRQLDFVAQELQREANTLTSKSIDTCITNAAISLKVFIEQIREQAQNIE